jgi:hypothetical protein
MLVKVITYTSGFETIHQIMSPMLAYETTFTITPAISSSPLFVPRRIEIQPNGLCMTTMPPNVMK